mmetsp:Transcript_35308/g.99519  ORF Transcript_35308/g.99519 Transcript_35308/m.99519 type:complete len:275 (+) Transcript_35308:54-878(+)|eukprot:CAMPEP_0119127438 /NCGR_PEP_ID=MMETSP1310-20130426/5993_1 /TAXON_ID=464262 /ORGANISM="Genus nov. species nov., Strain RCC2339" /LENGTH=274 /DNA_ID=CAMNT_0007117697 /DNA_START=54 /DNA_END=878 /DNA_ORIENTATION=-
MVVKAVVVVLCCVALTVSVGWVEGATSSRDATFSDYSYNPDAPNGPAFWATAVVGAEDCGGRRQSPLNIDVSSVIPYNAAKTLMTNASDEYVQEELTNLNHTLEVVVVSPNPPLLNGYSLLLENYRLAQYHIHSPSEHQIDGVSYDLEVHWVHQIAGTGDNAVVAALFNASQECSSFLEPIAQGAGEVPRVGDTTVIETSLRPPVDGDFFHYRGSLTTPPCTENVDWYVMQTIQPVCESQLAQILPRLDSTYPRNNRPIQPVDGRGIYRRTALP